MTWNPISESEVTTIVQEAVARMSPEDAKKFARIQTPIHAIRCRHRGDLPEENIFLVARVGSKVLVFDDVEDQFGVGDLAQSDVLEQWDLLGDLSFALTRF